MDKELFRETENKLIKYFNRNTILGSLKAELAILDKQIQDIDKDLSECNITIEEESSSPSFEQKVQTSSTGTSYAEREVMKVTELQIKRKINKQIERQNVLEEMDIIEVECNEIEWKVKDFTGELKTLLELSYKDKYGENTIANKMHLSQSQVNRRKQQIIRKIVMWNGWGKRCIKEE